MEKWAKRWRFTFPILMDPDGAVAASYALPDVLPDLPRDETVIAANLVIDGQGKICYYSLLDTNSFDAKLVELTRVVEKLLKQ